jgi:hypothetical protein
MTRTVSALVLGCVLLAGAAPDVRAADDAATTTPAEDAAKEREEYRKVIEQQKRQQEAMAARLSPLPGGTRRMQDLITATVEKGHLLLSSPLFKPETAAELRNRQWRADIRGFDGPATVMVQPNSEGGHYFYLTRTSYPGNDAADSISVMAQPAYTQISKNYTTDTLHYSVALVQNLTDDASPDDRIQFNIYAGGEPGKVNTRITLSEESFEVLRRKHPREVNAHLRPLLSELGLEGVFKVPAITAWQVFRDDWKGNPQVAAEVKKLLADLENGSYATRAAAGKALRELGPDAALVVYRMDRAGLSPEQNRQLDTVLSTYGFLPEADAVRLRNDVHFLLDCLYADDAEIRGIALKHLREVTKKSIEFDAGPDAEARGKAIEALRERLSPTTNPATRPTATRPVTSRPATSPPAGTKG